MKGGRECILASSWDSGEANKVKHGARKQNGHPGVGIPSLPAMRLTWVSPASFQSRPPVRPMGRLRLGGFWRSSTSHSGVGCRHLWGQRPSVPTPLPSGVTVSSLLPEQKGSSGQHQLRAKPAIKLQWK